MFRGLPKLGIFGIKMLKFQFTAEKVKSDSKWLYQTNFFLKCSVSAETLPRGSYRIVQGKKLHTINTVLYIPWFDRKNGVMVFSELRKMKLICEK